MLERALLHVAIRIAVMILIIIISKKYETVGNEFAASNPFLSVVVDQLLQTLRNALKLPNYHPGPKKAYNLAVNYIIINVSE